MFAKSDHPRCDTARSINAMSYKCLQLLPHCAPHSPPRSLRDPSRQRSAPSRELPVERRRLPSSGWHSGIPSEPMTRLPSSSCRSRVPGRQVGMRVVGSGAVVVVVVDRVVVRVVVGRVVVVVVGRGGVAVVGRVMAVEARVVVLMTPKPTRGFPPRLKMGLSWGLAKGFPCRPCPKRGRPSGLTTGVPPRSETKSNKSCATR